MIRDINDTIQAYLQAFTLASRYKLYPYLLLSGLLSLTIGGIIFSIAYFSADTIGNWLESIYPWEWGSGAVDTLTSWLSGILILVIGFFVYKYIILIVVAPIMSPLSEKLEEGLRGDSDGVNFSFSRMLSEMIRGVRIGLRNILRELFYTVLLLLLGFIPGLAVITTPGIYAVQSYYLGFGNMDYFLERHYGVRGSVRFVRKHKGIALANGAIFFLLLLIPIAGLFLAPFLSTIAATKVCFTRLPQSADMDYI